MPRTAEWILGIAGALVCTAAAIMFSSQDPLWPLPGLYLAKIGLAGLLALGAIAVGRNDSGLWAAVPWVASGIVLAFAILGAWTIGLFIAPGAPWRNRSPATLPISV